METHSERVKPVQNPLSKLSWTAMIGYRIWLDRVFTGYGTRHQSTDSLPRSVNHVNIEPTTTVNSLVVYRKRVDMGSPGIIDCGLEEGI